LLCFDVFLEFDIFDFRRLRKSNSR